MMDETTEKLDLSPSTLKLPSSDRRDQLIKEVDTLCREIIEVTHKLYKEQNERMIGRLEERWFTLRRQIYKIQEDAYLNEGIYLAIGTTDLGCPIHVRKPYRMLPWGRAFVA